MEKISKAIDAINKWIGTVLGYLAVLMAFLITYEVVARYIFNAPTIWSMEINQYLFCAVSLLGGGYCLLTEGHVRVDLFYPKFKPKTQAIVEMVTYPLALAFCAILVFMGGSEFWHELVTKNTSGTVLDFPMWPVWLTVPLGGLLLGLQILARYLRHINTFLTDNE